MLVARLIIAGLLSPSWSLVVEAAAAAGGEGAPDEGQRGRADADREHGLDVHAVGEVDHRWLLSPSWSLVVEAAAAAAGEGDPRSVRGGSLVSQRSITCSSCRSLPAPGRRPSRPARRAPRRGSPSGTAGWSERSSVFAPFSFSRGRIAEVEQGLHIEAAKAC